MQRIDSLRRSLRDSFRRSKKESVESSKPHQWLADEEAVRIGNCYFSVKYLGCVEVYESRGMQVCEEAMKILRENLNPGARRRPVKAIIYVSGDGLRVVEDETKGLVVDQTIEKVSFCAPDRNHEKGFSYICRDGTTRRWMLYGFLATKDSGERLSHAVGCAFAACLERKQRREKEIGVQLTFDAKTSSFNRSSSMRSNSITDRPPVPPPPASFSSRNGNNSNSITSTAATTTPGTSISNSFSNNFSNNENKSQNQQQPSSQNENAQNGNNNSTTTSAIKRPSAPLQMLERQNSFRGFQQLANRSPFKRQLSLRLSELPSTIERTQHSAIDILTSHNITLSPPSQPDTTSMSGSNDTLPSLVPSGFNNIFNNNNSNPPPNPVPPMRLQMRSRLHSLPTNSLSGISEGTAGDFNGGKIENKDLVSELCQQVTLGLSQLAADHEEFKANNDSSQFPTNSTSSKNPWDQVDGSSAGVSKLPVLDTINSVTTMGNNRISTIPASDTTSPPSQVNSGRGGGGSWNERTSPTKTIISNSFSETKFSPVKTIPGIYTDHKPFATTSAASPTKSSVSTTITKSNIDRDFTSTTDKPARPPLVSSKSLSGPALQQRPIYKGALQSHKRSQSFDQPKVDPFDSTWATEEKPLNPFKQTFQFAI